MTALMKAVVVLVLLTLMVLTPSYGDGHARGESLGLSVEAYPAKCQFKPGETVSIEVVISNAHAWRACGELSVSIKRLAEEVHVVHISIEVQPRASLTREFRWAPPPEVAGYGVDVALEVGADLLRASTAFDVVDSWTRAPRYGFLCDFPHEDADVGKRADSMNRYHINAVQFYDWMYRHDTLLPGNQEFTDSMGRRLSIRTVESKIRTVKEFGMVAMAYVTVYAASREFFEKHRDWALWERINAPYTLGDGYLYLMNPARNSPWHARMMSEYQQAVSCMGFDGLHIDQYGYPKDAFTTPTCDAESLLRVDRVFADFVDDAKDAVGKVRPGAYVVFNCVNNWPVENIAPSDADIVYIEVWPPHDTYADIVELISEGRRLGSGKAVVLAAYLSPAFEPSVRYLDAVIFSAGGSHIELGEGENMLADPYFPKYERIPSRLAHALRRYYDFCTRYVELLYLGVTEGAPGVEVSVLDYPSTTQDSAEEEIWLFPKRKENLVIINLVNFLRVKVPLWRSDQQAPPILSDVRLRVRLERPLSEVYFASPEYEDGKMVKLEAIRVGEPREYAYEFVAPHLEYWSTVVIREQAG